MLRQQLNRALKGKNKPPLSPPPKYNFVFFLSIHYTTSSWSTDPKVLFTHNVIAHLFPINDMENVLPSRRPCITPIYSLFAYEISRIIKGAVKMQSLLLHSAIKSSIFYRTSSLYGSAGPIGHMLQKILKMRNKSSQLSTLLLGADGLMDLVPYGQFLIISYFFASGRCNL